MTHIWFSDITNIGSDNGWSPGRCQAVIRTNAGVLLIRPLRTSSSEMLIEIHIFPLTKTHLKMSSEKCRPFCLGLNELMRYWTKPIFFFLPNLYPYHATTTSALQKICGAVFAYVCLRLCHELRGHVYIHRNKSIPWAHEGLHLTHSGRVTYIFVGDPIYL